MTAKEDIRKREASLYRKARGFTLVEILIVLALIGIVAGVAMSNLGEIFGGGKVKAAQTWVNSTGEAYVNSYFALVGDYPKTLGDLRNPPNGVPPFVKRASDLQDPWGKEYQYAYPGARNTGSTRTVEETGRRTPGGRRGGSWRNGLLHPTASTMGRAASTTWTRQAPCERASWREDHTAS